MKDGAHLRSVFFVHWLGIIRLTIFALEILTIIEGMIGQDLDIYPFGVLVF